MIQFTVENKKITIYPAATPDKPIVYLNTFSGEGDSVYEQICSMSCLDFTFVAISGLNWNHDMSPWSIPPIMKEDTTCTGGANDYLQLLTGAIILKVENMIKERAAWRGLAGYSLAGLFAVYSMYHTDSFSRLASISGSLWFPYFKEYVFSHEMMGKPYYMYFSLGDKECRTKNAYLKPVQINTESIEAFYKAHGINTAYQLNQGGHHKDAVMRTAKGITGMLSK